MKIIIRNLARSIKETELKEMFEKYGEVKSCDLVMDKATGKSKGFGFVEMMKPKDSKFAIKGLNNTKVNNVCMRVKKAEEK